MKINRIGMGVFSTMQRGVKYLNHHSEKDKGLHLFKNYAMVKSLQEVDFDLQGVSFMSNKILKELHSTDCDYYFLFNDDCFPIKDGWADFFIDGMKANDLHHVLYLDARHEPFMVSTGNGFPYSAYKNAGGVFMAFSSKCLEKVGGFNQAFKGYGYEHCEYSQRVVKAGLQEHAYVSFHEAKEYLYAIDYQGPIPELPMVDSISLEQKNQHLEDNHQIFINSQEIYIPL